MSTSSNGDIWRHTLASVQFLSRLPTYRFTPNDEPIDFSKSAWTFPFAGLIIALPASVALYLALMTGLDALIAAIVALVIQLLVTGALHEDGFADVADGFWGGSTQERKLEIMRDSAIGTYGTLALICSILLRVGLLTAILRNAEPVAAVALYAASESLSRLAILSPWTALHAARPTNNDEVTAGISGKTISGLSARNGVPSVADFGWATLCALPAILLLIFLAGAGTAIFAMLGGALFTGLMVCLADRHIGGHTGDVLGATQQLALLGLYLGLVIAI